MKYAVKYRKDFRHINEVDELIFDYNESDEFVDFITKLKPEQRVTIRLSYDYDVEKSIPFLSLVKQKHNNMMVQIQFSGIAEEADKLRFADIPFMFTNYCRTCDEIKVFKEFGTEEVYVVEDLGFNIKKLQYFREDGLKIRLIPDIAQGIPSVNKYVEGITKFWIRPEDINLYEKYVDTMELMRMDDRLSITYELYKQEYWKGQLNLLIMDADDLDIESGRLDPRFGLHRLTCGRRCSYGECGLCKEFAKLARDFEVAKIEVTRERKKPEISKEEKEEILSKVKGAEDES